MTGPVTWETLIGLAGMLGAIVAVWLRIEWKIGEIIKPMNTTMGAIQGEVALLREQLAAHKLYAANHYAKIDDVREMRAEIITRLDDMNGRLDRAFAPASRARPPAS